MDNRLDSADVYIQDTGTAKGRGAFAARDFSAGSLVEEAPVVVILRRYDQLPPRIQKIVYNWGALAALPRPCSAIVMGYGSMYNHDNPANLRYVADGVNETLSYIAARDIAKDEELTVNYNAGNGSNVSTRDDWFEQHGIEIVSDDK